MKSKKAFAEGYLQIFSESKKCLDRTPWWNLSKVKHYRNTLRFSQHHYNKLTGKQIEL